MADDEDDQEETEPAVPLGEGEPIEGAPVARIASRLTWPQEKSRIERKEGEVRIRTPDGPRTLGEVLAEVETTYFDSRQAFVSDVKAVVGDGPVRTAE